MAQEGGGGGVTVELEHASGAVTEIAAAALTHDGGTFTVSASTRASAKPVLFLDCDDTLYTNDWLTANAITRGIESYCMTRLGLEKGRAYELYKQHGTCLAGLIAEKIDVDVEDFLTTVHPTREELATTIGPDAALRALIERIDRSKVEVFVFTASSREHCARCLSLLGVDDLLVDKRHPIIDCRSVAPAGFGGTITKHSTQAFAEAQRIAGQPDADKCYFVDDSWSNIRAATGVGWHAVLLGAVARDGRSAELLAEKEAMIAEIALLPTMLPDLFL